MRIAIAGGHGQIALLLTGLLRDAGHEVVSIIRNPDHADDVSTAGGSAVVLDLEQTAAPELASAIGGADVLVFAAGAGPGSGVARKYTVDHQASTLCVAAAEMAGVPRFVQISSMGTEQPPQDDDVFSHYLRAKAAAEQEVRASGLASVILRPGMLTNAPATGSVTLARHVPRGAVPRGDVAAVVAELIRRPWSGTLTLELTGGQTSVTDAVAASVGAPAEG